MRQESDVFRDKLQTVEIVRQLYLLDKTTVHTDHVYRLIHTGGNEGPKQVTCREKHDILGEILRKHAAKYATHNDNENQHTNADPPRT